MNALQSYSSENESDEEPTLRKMNKLADSGTNYDDVGMDISEESCDDTENENEHRQSEVTNYNNVRASINATNTNASSKNGTDNSSEVFHKRRETYSPSDEDRKGSETSEGGSTKENEKKDEDKNKGRVSEERTKDHHRHSRSHRKRERSRERNNRDNDRSVRDHRELRRSTDSRDYRRPNRVDDRKSSSRRSRSHSRDRRRTRSRSRSRDRRKRRTRSRSRSRSRERDRDRKRPHEIRKEAQQKLAAFKASNPNFDHNEMLKRGMEAQFAEVQKNTGVTLPSYYNPATMNPLKIAEQERKKKLLWGNKSKAETTANIPVEQPSGGSAEIWVNTKFSNDSDGKMAEKFKRLMGVKTAGSTSTVPQAPERSGIKDGSEIMEKQETLFNSMEKQYEMARLATHTHKGFGLGFTSQSYLPK